ncbi:hypothetical protein ABEH28_04870 [Pseudomonas sp. Ps21-P2]|uniref:hypothetical protein n=1 Tax=Pseudomonas sp. Ps21-P2 TaxID=3080331 RepID=UPI0032082092
MSKFKNALRHTATQSGEPRHQDPFYPKPLVTLATNAVLDPTQVSPAGMEIKVSYPTIKTGDVIALIFNRIDTFVPIEVGDERVVSFWISASYIVPTLGETVEIYYKTVSSEGDVNQSEVLQLTVLPFMDGDLKMAKVEQASDGAPGELDLSKFAGDADISIEPWPLIAAGQRVWLDMVSNKGTSNILKSYSVTNADISAGITHGISRTELLEIANNSEITFPLKVQFDGTDTVVGAKEFSTLKLRLLGTAGGTEYSENFNDLVPRVLDHDLNTLNMKVSFGTTRHPNEIASENGSIYLKMHTAKTGGIVIITFNRGITPSYVSFDLAVTDGACVVYCYNDSDTIPQERGVSDFKTMRFDAPGIKELRFYAINAIPMETEFLLDNFRFNDTTGTPFLQL